MSIVEEVGSGGWEGRRGEGARGERVLILPTFHWAPEAGLRRIRVM